MLVARVPSGEVVVRIKQHRLHRDDGAPVRFEPSPNSGGKVQHKYLVMHYTAGRDAESAVRTLVNPATKASAHLVIGRGGELAQLVPFNRIAWHAGQSRWLGLQGLNHYSIGIELDNAGRLERQGGRWLSWFGKEYPEQDVHEATHKNETRPAGWHIFTEAQLGVAVEVSRLLARHYGLVDVLGHDDIAPGRKSDPGPAFPMASFRSAVIGREADDDEIYQATANLNIRVGPGLHYAKLVDDALPKGTRLSLQRREGSWCLVDVLDDDGQPVRTGWVHGNYIGAVA